jgi:DNA-binding MarR family transcriptional regulator
VFQEMVSPSKKQPLPGRGDGEEETADLIRLIVETAGAIDSASRSALAEADIPSIVAAVLWTIDPAAAPPTMRDLAKRLRCDPSTISLTADKLETMGLMDRQPHPSDGRKRVLTLTERGRELRSAISAQLDEAGILARLTPSERATLATLLSKMRDPQPSSSATG